MFYKKRKMARKKPRRRDLRKENKKIDKSDVNDKSTIKGVVKMSTKVRAPTKSGNLKRGLSSMTTDNKRMLQPYFLT